MTFERVDSFIDDDLSDYTPVVWCMAENSEGEIWFGSMYDGVFVESSPSNDRAGYEIEKLDILALKERNTIYAIESARKRVKAGKYISEEMLQKRLGF
jgi:hypothetical protein